MRRLRAAQVRAQQHEQSLIFTAPAERVYRILADYEHHQRILPAAFSDFTIEKGGVGAGTVVSFKVSAGGVTQVHRDTVAEPEPGRVLTEVNDTGEVTTFTVTPVGGPTSGQTLVKIETRWPSRGLQGLVERLVAPRMLCGMFFDELERLEWLERYAQTQPLEAGSLDCLRLCGVSRATLRRPDRSAVQALRHGPPLAHRQDPAAGGEP